MRLAGRDTSSPQLRETLENAMRPVGGVRPYLGGPLSLFRFRQPAGATGHVGRGKVVYGGVPRHSSGVVVFNPVADTAMDARGFQNIGPMLGVIDPIKLVFHVDGDIH